MIDGLSVLGCRQCLRANAMRSEDDPRDWCCPDVGKG